MVNLHRGRRRTAGTQGSVLGPRLLHIIISDLERGVSSEGAKCADDTKLRLVRMGEGCEELQRGLNKLWEQANRQQVKCTVDKCKDMLIGGKELNSSYTSQASKLTVPTHERMRGI